MVQTAQIAEIENLPKKARNSFLITDVFAFFSWLLPPYLIWLLKLPLVESGIMRSYLDWEWIPFLQIFGGPIVFGLLGLLFLLIAYSMHREIGGAWWCIFGAIAWSIPLTALYLFAGAFMSGLRPN